MNFSQPYTIFGIFAPNNLTQSIVRYPIRIVGPVGTVGFYLYQWNSQQAIWLVNRTLSTPAYWTPVQNKRYPFVISSNGSYSALFIDGKKLISSGPAGTTVVAPYLWLCSYKGDWGYGYCWLDEVHIIQKQYSDAQIMRYLGHLKGRLL